MAISQVCAEDTMRSNGTTGMVVTTVMAVTEETGVQYIAMFQELLNSLCCAKACGLVYDKDCDLGRRTETELALKISNLFDQPYFPARAPYTSFS